MENNGSARYCGDKNDGRLKNQDGYKKNYKDAKTNINSISLKR